jgi:hypothetical protein
LATPMWMCAVYPYLFRIIRPASASDRHVVPDTYLPATAQIKLILRKVVYNTMTLRNA